MRCSAKHIAVRLGLVLLLISALPAAENPQSSATSSDTMTIWQARRTVVAGDPAWQQWGPDRRSFRFTADSFEFTASRPAIRNERFNIDLRRLDEVGIKCRSPWQNNNSWCSLVNAQGKGLSGGPVGLWYLYYERWHDSDDVSSCSARCISTAHAFAAAINRLRAYAIDTESPLRTFAQRAAAWRALPTKPAIPEAIRLQRMLAEDAVKQNKPAEALNRYETGLEQYPTWPQGWFNAALIAAELGFYTDAVEHMQTYLELVPEAPDAQAARDQIAMWQFKAKETK